MACDEGDHNFLGGKKESYKNRKKIKMALNYLELESKYVGQNCVLSEKSIEQSEKSRSCFPEPGNKASAVKFPHFTQIWKVNYFSIYLALLAPIISAHKRA